MTLRDRTTGQFRTKTYPANQLPEREPVRRMYQRVTPYESTPPAYAAAATSKLRSAPPSSGNPRWVAILPLVGLILWVVVAVARKFIGA